LITLKRLIKASFKLRRPNKNMDKDNKQQNSGLGFAEALRDRLSLIRLSQGHLNLLETCPPKFQQVYLDNLASLFSPEQQEKATWGSRFHLLMQQRELGLPIEDLLEADEELHHSLNALIEAAPEILQKNNDTWREAEHCRTLSFNKYLLTVIYDLLIAEPRKARIIDWKTYLQPQNKTKLAHNWQTRLYLYILAETSEYLPKQISLTYWFVKLPQKPKSITFTYNKQKHEQTKQDLTSLLNQLDICLNDYLNQNISFPHRSNCQINCPYYPSGLKDVTQQLQPEEQTNLIASIAEIQEVSL
jgi:hypothetical protein